MQKQRIAIPNNVVEVAGLDDHSFLSIVVRLPDPVSRSIAGSSRAVKPRTEHELEVRQGVTQVNRLLGSSHAIRIERLKNILGTVVHTVDNDPDPEGRRCSTNAVLVGPDSLPVPTPQRRQHRAAEDIPLQTLTSLLASAAELGKSSPQAATVTSVFADSGPSHSSLVQGGAGQAPTLSGDTIRRSSLAAHHGNEVAEQAKAHHQENEASTSEGTRLDHGEVPSPREGPHSRHGDPIRGESPGETIREASTHAHDGHGGYAS